MFYGLLTTREGLWTAQGPTFPRIYSPPDLINVILALKIFVYNCNMKSVFGQRKNVHFTYTYSNHGVPVNFSLPRKVVDGTDIFWSRDSYYNTVTTHINIMVKWQVWVTWPPPAMLLMTTFVFYCSRTLIYRASWLGGLRSVTQW